MLAGRTILGNRKRGISILIHELLIASEDNRFAKPAFTLHEFALKGEVQLRKVSGKNR